MGRIHNLNITEMTQEHLTLNNELHTMSRIRHSGWGTWGLGYTNIATLWMLVLNKMCVTSFSSWRAVFPQPENALGAHGNKQPMIMCAFPTSLEEACQRWEKLGKTERHEKSQQMLLRSEQHYQFKRWRAQERASAEKKEKTWKYSKHSASRRILIWLRDFSVTKTVIASPRAPEG